MSATTQQMEIRDHGQIGSMSLPTGWIEQSVEKISTQSVRRFHPPDDLSVAVYLYYRGRPLHEESAKNLASILAEAPHDLLDSEWWDIQEVVRDAAFPDVFNLNVARTTDWNGRRVLFVGGRWPISEEESFTIYVSADKACTHIQEIIYLSPQSKLPHWPIVERSLLTIRWTE